jgi:alcohol dehydrogenase class IV
MLPLPLPLENSIARLRILGLGIATKVIPFPRPVSFVGPDSSLALCREIASSGIKRLVLVTDGPLRKLGVIDPMLAALKAAGVKVAVFDKIEPDPGYEMIEAGVAFLSDHRAEAVIAVGGGSSIDGAKTMVACYANDRHPSELVGLFKVRRSGVPFYAVPTTAGTGSEVTVAAVVTDKEAQQKHSIIDPKLVPQMVALDPKLMTGLPPHITAATGMDALTHAVEAYISTLATAETDALARAATAAIVRNLPLAYKNGSDLDVRERMALASFNAGLAFTRAGVGYVHAIAHQMGGLYHVPHGLANAIIMPYVLDYSLPACAGRLAELARCAGIGTQKDDDTALARKFVAHVRKMNAQMGIPTTIKQLRREDFDTIIDRALGEAHGTYAVPRYLTPAGAAELLDQLMPD